MVWEESQGSDGQASGGLKSHGGREGPGHLVGQPNRGPAPMASVHRHHTRVSPGRPAHPGRDSRLQMSGVQGLRIPQPQSRLPTQPPPRPEGNQALFSHLRPRTKLGWLSPPGGSSGLSGALGGRALGARPWLGTLAPAVASLPLPLASAWLRGHEQRHAAAWSKGKVVCTKLNKTVIY